MKGHSLGDESLLAHLRAIFAALPVGVCSRDGERRIVYLNRFAEELTGYREHEVRGEFCHVVLRHSAAGRALCEDGCAAEAALAGRVVGGPTPLSVHTAGGGWLSVSSRFEPLLESTGRVAGFVETFTPRSDLSPEQPAWQEEAAGLDVDLERRAVYREGRPVRLTKTEFELLACLARNAGKSVCHAELLRQVWGPECEGQTQYLHTFVSQLRHKLEIDPGLPRHLVTEPHYGYRLRLRPEEGADIARDCDRE